MTAEFDLLHRGVARVRITNPLASDEAVLRATIITGLVRAWGGTSSAAWATSCSPRSATSSRTPTTTASPAHDQGWGRGGSVTLALPERTSDSPWCSVAKATTPPSAVALWATLAERLGLADVVVRTSDSPEPGFHPTRVAQLVDRASGAVLGSVGEVDSGAGRGPRGFASSSRSGRPRS